MSLTRLKDFLDSYGIKYVVISHSLAYTAQGIAALTHTPRKELAKTVVVKIDGNLAMAVVPASSRVDVGLLKAATRAKTAEIAAEEEFKIVFLIVRLALCRRLEIFTEWRPLSTKLCRTTRRSHSMQDHIGSWYE